MLLMTQTLEVSYEVEHKTDFSYINTLDRWKELSHLACDVSNHLDFYLSGLKEDEKSNNPQPFDLGYKKGRQSLFQSVVLLDGKRL